MRTHNYGFFVFIFAAFMGLMFLLPNSDNQKLTKESGNDRIKSTSSPKAGIEAKKGRWEYFNTMLRDPATGEIPKGIRQKELAFAENLQKKSLLKTTEVNALEWKEAGPYDVGGRTRALAVDITNPSTILAGGITGGMWKSTDKGATWSMKSTTSQVLSVTTVAQDPRSGETSTWYYASGEWDGSGPDLGYTAYFYGGGIYKSIDNGENWNLLSNASGGSIAGYDGPFDFVSKIIVHPNSGTVFAASNIWGIMKSTDGGNSWGISIGGNSDHIYSDIGTTSDGTLIAALSTGWTESPANSPGIYKSTDDGVNWTNITPNNFPAAHERSVLAIAPSNPNVVYVVTNTGDFADQEREIEIINFFKINISNGSSEDRSQNLPEIEAQYGKGIINTQWNYNLVMAVKPDDENFVMIGATSLFKSEDGFATKPTDPLKSWIGGYSANPDHFPFYPNFHPDIHSFAFNPNNPNEMWWGHDGGITFTDQLNNNSYTEQFPWSNMNNGYNVTQFYTISIPSGANDYRIMGGTQDNGTPFFTFDGNNTSAYTDASLADGSFCYFGKQYAYTSRQEGWTYRIEYDQSGTPLEPWGNEGFTVVNPVGASGQLFINPFTIDPTDENIMYYLAGNTVWRNNALSSIPDNNWERTTTGWTELTNTRVPDGYVVSTLASSNSNPSHVLYYGASDKNREPGPPKIYKLENANNSNNPPLDISISGSAAGAYVHNIAVNPDNGDELIVVFSNYKIPGIFHSNNGGQSFTSIEGNLEGNQNNGPSIRAATVLPTSNGTLYLVATSIGIYSTSQLNGAQTTWTLEGADVVGNVIVNSITSRRSDGRIVAGTHGRGAFVGQADAVGVALANTNVTSLTLQSRPGESGSTSFLLSNDGEANLNFNISATGSFGNILPKSGSEYVLYNKTLKDKTNRFKNRTILNNSIPSNAKIDPSQASEKTTSPQSVLGDNVLWLDDGDDTADDIFGWSGGGGGNIYWYNEFDLNGFSFQLESFTFYMRTDQAISNDLYLGVFDQYDFPLAEDYLTLGLAATGGWFTITLDSPITFNDGETFSIEIGSLSFISSPVGVDVDAAIPNKSYYGDGFTYYNLNTVPGAANGAFIIRAIGTVGGGVGNQDPVAIANISKTQVEINETITFDGSQSYDNDGSIITYSWNFGDGNNSSQQSTNHAYAQANTYTYTLTVSDDKGATGQTSGQIMVSDPTNEYITVQPSNGTIAPGGSQTIMLSLNAQSISEGNYTGQVNITTNGGNITIPIDYLVDVEKISRLPKNYNLSQNYPNPFNPSTTITFSLPKTSEVVLKVYDMLGKEVKTLINENKFLGTYKVTFDASNLASGIYVYRLETDDFVDSKKLVLLK